ncbi:GM11529 [Drosophila sechellia]|uniref:GM11529 n=1 Tax=Drosophila sechellia TaxID=7238 RepID=B4IGJ7_DROSE|nr:GM11529 [Drosophila sechellia]
MSSRFKSRIPERVRNSLTVLDGPNSRISRIRDAAQPNRSSLNRSHMPLPISNTLSALVKPVSPKAVFKKTLTEEEAVIRSLVRRSKPLAVRGNRTSFRRIQLAHAAPIGDSSVLLKATDSFCSADFRLQKPIKEAIPPDPEEDPAASRTAKSLLDLVAGRRQPGMEQMRFLCSDHRLINVPTSLMYRHSRIMSHLEMEVQPIPLRSIRSVTLLRVIMWMHKKTLCSNGTEKVAEAKPTVETCISDIHEGNGYASSETSCQISEITQGDNANDDQCVADLNEMKRSSYLLCSWEERLLGNELYQLVEIILASHYLGIESLTMNAIHHFCELMAQRTRSECCLMLRIKTRLAGDNHCPLIRESLSLGCHRNNQADGSEIEKQQFEPNSRIARIFRKHRPNGRAAIGGGIGDGL